MTDKMDFDQVRLVVARVAKALNIAAGEIEVEHSMTVPGCGTDCGGPCQRQFSSITLDINLDDIVFHDEPDDDRG